MSTTTIEVETSVVDAIAAAIAARDEGMRQAEEADRSGWNKALIDQAIDAMALTRRPFSANDLRELLPSDVPTPLIGSRFQHASRNRGVIRRVGLTTSTKKNTHGKDVGQWVGVHH